MSGIPVVAKWRLVPALTLAGFVSAIFTDFIWWPSIVAANNSEVLYVVLGSTSFGLAVGSVIWFYSLLESWKILACLVVVTVTAHFLELQAEVHAGARVEEYVDILFASNIEPLVAVTSFGVAAVLYLVWIFVTSPHCRIISGAMLALGCASLAALTITAIHGTQRGAWISFLTGKPLELVWQTALAGFLGLALALKQTHLFHVQPAAEKPRSSFAKRMAISSVLVGYFLVIGAWSISVEKRDAKIRAQVAASVEAEAATKLAHAPSFDNLPPLTDKPFDEVLVWQNVGDWTPSAPGSYDSPAVRSNPSQNRQAQIAPERRTYYLSYSKSGVGDVRANVTVYPNEQWARYEVDIPPITRQTRNIQLVQRFGNHIYQDGVYLYWSSGQKVVKLECQGVLPDVIDEFLKVYLQKFPSNV